MAKVKRILLKSFYVLLSSLIFLIVVEFSIRVFFSHINYQGNQLSLFVENRFKKTMGLMPNSSGVFFGKEIFTDEHGFRQMNTPSNYDESYLFLGDSVTFGVSIDPDQIFPQLIQNEFQRTKIWNTAVIGYSTLNYLDVVDVLLGDYDGFEKVVLFFCLNDVYGNLSLKPEADSIKEKVFTFLRSNSKLYLLLMNSFFDRSKEYALYDIGLYKEGNSDIDEHLNAIFRIKKKLDESNTDFLVVILPYEYQLRVGGLKSPQTLVTSFFSKNNIKSVDLYDDFTLHNSENYFLYGDPMHLSSLGHQVVAKKMLEILR